MDTSSKILSCAEKLFVEQGYERTTMDQIAAQIGMSKGALYYFFKNKSDLFCRIVDDGLDFMDGFVEQSLTSEESGEIVAQQLIRKYVDMAYDNSGIVRMLLGSQVFGEQSPVSEMLKPRLRRLLAGVERMICAGRAEGTVISADCTNAAKAALGMVYGIIALPNPPNREEAIRSIFNFLKDGLYCEDKEDGR